MASYLDIDFAPLPGRLTGGEAVLAFAFTEKAEKSKAKAKKSPKAKPPKEKQGARLSMSAAKADSLTGGAVSKAMRDTEFTGALGTSLTVRGEKGVVIIIGAGAGLEAGCHCEDIGGHVASALQAARLKKATLLVDSDDGLVIEGLGLGAVLASYGFNSYFTKGPNTKKPVRQLTIASPLGKAAAKGFGAARELIEGVFLARDLTYEPANVLYPESFAGRCKKLGKHGIKVSVLKEAQMKKQGMNLLLAVGQGSARESRMVVMRYDGGKRGEAPLALIGKGVCFDTGGISIKPAGGMEDMKWDMGGAAAVTGAMRAIAGRKIRRNVVGLIGLVENMPDGNATRPGDVVKSMSGQTVEIINTDAEGRLVLADVLSYAKKHHAPARMINLATLTGAVLVALGKEHAGLFSNNDALAEAIAKAGLASGEKVWRLPLGKDYDNLLKSHIADMKNIGGRYAGSITAACFLERFVGDTPWAHLDIAGMAWADRNRPTVPRGGTGYGVRLLTRLVEEDGA